MYSKKQREEEWDLLNKTVARLRAGVMAVIFGTMSGISLFVATAWLLVRGGPTVGWHLALLNNYFPGYSVSWPGAFIGLFYGGLTGAVLGWLISWIYNRIARSHGPF